VHIGEPEDARFVRGLIAGRQWDAFVCANDHTAAVLLRSLEHVKWKVPRDVRVVGFDDVKYSTLLGVTLTTIHQPCRDIAVTAFRAMLERGVNLPPSQYEAWFLSMAHGDAEISAIVEAARAALRS